MLGDIASWFKRVWKENTCMHEYKSRGCMSMYDQCSKCGRVR